MSPTTILLLILFVALSGIVFALFTLKRRDSREYQTISERIRPYVDQAYREELARQKSTEAREETLTLLSGIADHLSEVAISEEIQQKMRDWLLRAGLRVRPAEFVVICIMMMLITGIMTGLVGFQLFGGRATTIGLIGFAAGWIFPTVYVLYSRNKRMKKFNNQLPELIVLMSNGLKSGYGFSQALTLVAEEAQAPAAEEFERVIMENRYGIPIDDALVRMVERIDSQDLDLIVTAILIQRQVGGKLSEILDQIGATIRERIQLKGQINALTSQGKLSGGIISFLPVGLGIIFYLIRTEMMVNFIFHPFGLAAIGFGIFWQAIGIFIIWRIISIDL